VFAVICAESVGGNAELKGMVQAQVSGCSQ
jgi:hypothetical protein